MFLYRPFDLDSRVEREARSLVGAGYEVEVMALPGPGLPERESRDGYTIHRVSPEGRTASALRRASQTRLPSPLRRVASGANVLLRMRRWARRSAAAVGTRPTLVIAHDLDGLLAGVRLKRRMATPLVYDAHELYPDLAAAGRPRYELRAWIRWESRLIRHADLVLAVTPSRAEVMARRFAIPTPRVIRNVPETAGAPDRPAAGLRDQVPAGAHVVFYSGGMQPTRGLEQALQALAQLPRCFLVLMGSGEREYVDRLRMLAEQAGVLERVVFHPPVRPHEVVAVTAAADVGIVLNQNVGLNNYLSLPNKLFEYVAAGLPVVASDSPDMAALVRRYEVGELCDPEDPAGVARAITAVLDDPERHERLRANARRAAPELTWERESGVFLAAIRGQHTLEG